MTKRNHRPQLSDVLICPTPIKGPPQLAVHLAKQAKKKQNPATEAVVIWMDEQGRPDIAWSELTPEELQSLWRFFSFIVEDIFREAFYDQLPYPEDYDQNA